MYAKTVKFQTNRILSVVELATPSHDTLKYISSEDAIKKKKIAVTEISEAGSVNKLSVANDSDDYIFMMDGDILEGAKQTRVLNTSVFFAPHSKTTIPVSCVEQGRWSYMSPRFKSARYAAPPAFRAKKSSDVSDSLKRKRGYTSNQGEVWDDVERYQRSHDIRSMTSSLSDVYENWERTFNDCIKDLTPSDEANGFAIFVEDILYSFDIFNRRDIYKEYFYKILRGAAMEARMADVSAHSLTKEDAESRIAEFIDRIARISSDTHPGVALGEEKRFGSKDVTGFELVYDDLLVHLTAFDIKPAREKTG